MPPAISLAYEQPEKDIMKRPPRSRKSKVGDWSLISLRNLIFDLAAPLQIASVLLIHCDGNNDDLWMLPSLHECILVSVCDLLVWQSLIFDRWSFPLQVPRYCSHGHCFHCGTVLEGESDIYCEITLIEIVKRPPLIENFLQEGAENFTTVSGNITLSVTDQLKIKGEAAAAWQITLVLAQVR